MLEDMQKDVWKGFGNLKPYITRIITVCTVKMVK